LQRITLTQFIDYIFEAPHKRKEVVKKIKHKDQMFSYYEPFKRAVREYHYEEGDRQALSSCWNLGTNDAQKRHLKACVDGYLRWLDRVKPSPIEVPFTEYPIGGLAIRINPDVGLGFRGSNYALKLYLKEKTPPAGYDKLLTALMIVALGNGRISDPKPRILAVRDPANIFRAPAHPESHIATLEMESRSFLDWWAQV